MFTRAGRQAIHIFSVWTLNNDSNNAVPMFPESQSIKNTNGETRWVSYVNGNLYNTLDPQYNDRWSGVSFGSGTTPPTLDDYKIESIFNNQQINASLTRRVRGIDSNGKPYMELTYIVTNKSNASITVSEVATVTYNIAVCSSYSDTSANNNDILIDRTLLDTPITIPVGDSASIKYRITCDMSFT